MSMRVWCSCHSSVLWQCFTEAAFCLVSLSSSTSKMTHLLMVLPLLFRQWFDSIGESCRPTDQCLRTRELKVSLLQKCKHLTTKAYKDQNENLFFFSLKRTRTFFEQTRIFLEETRFFRERMRIFLDQTRIFLEGTRMFLERTRILLEQTKIFLEGTRFCLEELVELCTDTLGDIQGCQRCVLDDIQS